MSHRRIWKRLLAAFGGLLLAWLLIALFFDPGPVDDSDLALPERKVDPAQNPYPEIRDFSLSEEGVKEIGRLDSMVEGEEVFEEAFVQSVLERNAEVLERFERYAAMRDWWQDEPVGSNMDFNYLFGWIRLAILKRAESIWLASRGEREAAIESAVSVLKFAAGLRASGGPLLTALMADSISGIGAKGVARLLQHHEFTGDELACLAAKLDDPVFSRNDLESVLRTEYAFIAATAMDRATFERVVRPTLSETPAWLPLPLAYKSNRTRSMLGDFYRAAVRASDGDCRSFIAEIDGAIPLGQWAKWSNVLTGNAIGFELCSLGNEPSKGAFQRSFAVQAQHSLLRVFVAMKRYRLDHGERPATLDLLVPAYLEAVPTDPMDGMPLRYNAKYRIVYSVGEDFTDDGGFSPDRRGAFESRQEISIELEPSDSASRPGLPEKKAAGD